MTKFVSGRFAFEQILVAGATIEEVTDSPLLATFIRARRDKSTRVTLILAAPLAGCDAQDRLARHLASLASPGAGSEIVVRVTDRSESIDAILDAHEVLIPTARKDDHGLLIRAWQKGLCVVNSVDQAERVAAFEDDYHVPAHAAKARRWYSVVEGQPWVITNPHDIVLDFGARLNPRIAIFNERRVHIGRGSVVGADSELNLYTAVFSMGQFCHTSSSFKVVGSRHTLHLPTTFAVSRGPYAFIGETTDKVGDIVIGNDVWFGTRVVLLPGTRVADGCVVGAGSVVTKSLTEPYGIYAGNPAKLVRFRFPAHVINWLHQIQWWDWPTSRLWQSRDFFYTDLSMKTEKELWQLVES